MQNGRVLFATHSLHFRVHTRVLLTLLVACAVTMALWAEPPMRASASGAAVVHRDTSSACAAPRDGSVFAVTP